MSYSIKNEDAIVLFSGGQDSTTCLYWAKNEFRNIYALCLSYGQRHINEVENARIIAQIANVPFMLLDASIISNLAPNSLVDKSIDIVEQKSKDSYPNTFVPGRNLLFATFASTIAYSKGIKHIILGVSQADYSGYPDCRNTFIHSLNTTLNLAMDKNFEIHTPLMNLNKADIWAMSDRLGIFDIIEKKTLTCYNGIKADGCGTCPSCKLRREGLKKYLESKKNKK